MFCKTFIWIRLWIITHNCPFISRLMWWFMFLQRTVELQNHQQKRNFKIMDLIILFIFSCPVTGLAPKVNTFTLSQFWPATEIFLTTLIRFSHASLFGFQNNITHVWNHPTSSSLISLFSCGLCETPKVCKSYKRSIRFQLFKNDELMSHADRKAFHNQRYSAGGKEGNQISAN